ncbi:P-loop containing nucleoside triphosphate hydrolase protein [Hypoxylon sp. FL0543]|nr:P-loop containing nucleoside triphosphate hydrolase protein [Hypoxylon sp. FL0543]
MVRPYSIVAPPHGPIMDSEVQGPSLRRITFTKDFSFTIPEVFRASRTVARWIDDLPTTVERDEPLGRASFQSAKQTVIPSEAINECDEDDQGEDQTTETSSSTSAAYLRKEKQGTNRGFMTRVSAVYRRLVTSRTEREAVKRFSIDMSPSGPTAPFGEDPSREQMRFIFVGDTGCGKSSLLLRFYMSVFNEDHIEIKYELFNKTVEVDGKDVDLEIWDTSGAIGLSQLGLLSYLAWDIVFFCFALDNIATFQKTQATWVDQIRKHCGDAPVVLVGLKKDTRMGRGMFAPLRPDLRRRLCTAENEHGDIFMRPMKYLECSAKTGENADRVFTEAVRSVRANRVQDHEVVDIRQHFLDHESRASAKFPCFK